MRSTGWHTSQVLRANGSWAGDGTTGKTVWGGLSWARNKAWLLRREDGAERATAVYITLAQSEFDQPSEDADLAAGTAGRHTRAAGGHHGSLVGIRFDIYRWGGTA